MDPIWLLPAVPALMAMTAFFVAGEYTVVAVRPTQIEEMRRRGHRSAANAIERLKGDTANAIGTSQVGITVASLGLGWIGEPAMTALLERLVGGLLHLLPQQAFRIVSLVISFTLVTLLTVVFSELLPKALTLQYVPVAARITAVPLLWLQRVLRPVVWLMNALANAVTRPLGLGRVDDIDEERVSVEELRLLTTEATREGVLSSRERALILNAMSLGDRTARHIMVPRVRVAYLDLQRSMDENRRVMGERLFSRFPLCDGGMDNVIGVVHTKEFLAAYNAEADVSVLQLIARPPIFVPETTHLDKLLPAFYERKSQMVLAVDEYGGVAGAVTLRDVVDELVRTVDHSLALTAESLRGDASGGAPVRLTVAGELPLHELAQRLNRDGWAADEPVTTVGGLLQERLGHLPHTGERVSVDGITLVVREADARVVRRVDVIARRDGATGAEKRPDKRPRDGEAAT